MDIHVRVTAQARERRGPGMGPNVVSSPARSLACEHYAGVSARKHKTLISSQSLEITVCHACKFHVCAWQEEIVDETDIYEDVDRRVLRRGGNRVDIASFLTLWVPPSHCRSFLVHVSVS